MSQDNKNIFYILIGLFLEYFDVMLYVHLIVAINKGLHLDESPYFKDLGVYFSYLTTIALRPLGALLWGYIGDKYGRKACVIVTPIVVAMGCAILVFLPDYRQVGEIAVVSVLFLRLIQGMGWVGEKTIANIYIIEVVPFKKAGLYSSIAGAIECLSAIAALGLGAIFIKLDPVNGWKYPFIIGGLIALFSIPIRYNLEESKEFLSKKKITNSHFEILYSIRHMFINYNSIIRKFFIIEFLFGVGFFFVYLYCSEIMQSKLSLSPDNIALHNFIVSFLQGIFILIYGWMSLYLDSLKIVQYRVLIYLASLPFIFWYFLTGELTEIKVYIVQTLICLLGMDHIPCLPNLAKVLPVFSRMKGFALSYGMGKFIMYIVTTIGIAFFVKEYGEVYLLVFFMLITAFVAWAIWTYPVYRE